MICIKIQKERVGSTSHSMPLFPSFYAEIEKNVILPAPTRNLFLDLAEYIAHILNVTDCWVCEGTNLGEQWPWEAKKCPFRSGDVGT